MAQSPRLLRPVAVTSGGTVNPPPPAVTYRILQEDSFKILTESGFPLRKEQNT
jgi:hypothetical protein